MNKGRSGAVLGFTIVELLVVIVVIGILAAITIISYTGITQKAIVATMQSDLKNASQQLKLFQVENSAYPVTIDCSIPDSNTNKCIKASGTNTYYYNSSNNTNPQTYSLVESNGTIYYKITDDGSSVVTDSLDYGLLGYWKFDENVGVTVADSSNGGNTGTLTSSNSVMGNFEETLDGFVLNCGGAPVTSYVDGVSGRGLKLWSSGGDGLACMHKSLDGDKLAGYTTWFYAKGYVRSIYWNGSAPSNLIQVDTGCAAGVGDATIYDDCNGDNPYNDWTLFKIVATSNISGGHLYLYNHANNIGEAHGSSYDFVTDTPGFVPGKSGNAISFDGVDDRVDLGNSSKLNVTTFSAAFWYRMPELSTTSYETAINLPNVFHVYFDSNGVMWASTPGRMMGVHTPTINNWYHIVLTNDGSSYRAYINGVLSQTWSCTPGSWNNSNFFMGGTGEFNGIIDNLRLYNRVMSATEIESLYNSNN